MAGLRTGCLLLGVEVGHYTSIPFGRRSEPIGLK